jgi:hypothetical protein
MFYNNRRPVGDDSWTKIIEFLPDRILNIYCAVLKKKTVSKTTSFFISSYTYLTLLVIFCLLSFISF